MLDPRDDILFERRGVAGVVTLNRPKALNAVTHAMVLALHRQLDAWARDAAIACVIVKSSTGRAFSAGGDIRALYDLGKAGHQDDALRFWRDEYVLNAAIKNYPKPYISLIDGIVMGGGVGLSIHGSHRIAGDHYQLAMPEVSIGFFPDVGATYFLSHLPGELGAWIALTGERVKAIHAVSVGIATHRVHSDRFEALIASLCGGTPVDEALAAVCETDLKKFPHQRSVNRCFNAGSVEQILLNLDRDDADADWAANTAKLIRTKSPTSLKLALAQMRRGKRMTLADCLRTEFRIVSRIVYGHDFYEGVRAAIIDKDGAPQWQPDALATVDEAAIERHFDPLGAEELML